MKTTVEQDSTDMEQFGGDTPYITSLKELLKKYNPSVSYWSNSRCTGEEFANNVCANRRAYLMFFHDEVKFSGDAATIATYTPTDFTLREAKKKRKRTNEKDLKKSLGRATHAQQGLFKPQFRNWLSGPDYEKFRRYAAIPYAAIPVNSAKEIRDIYELRSAINDMNAKPDFFSPVPPYPIKKTPESHRGKANKGAPLGWTRGQNSGNLSNPNSLLKTELAHLVDSGEWKWIQYLVNDLENKVFLDITPEMNIIEIKNKLDEMNTTHYSTMFEANDKDPDYYVSDNFEEAKTRKELWHSSLYVLDSAANIVTLNARAHHMLFDKLMKSSGSPNMSANKKHSFFTLDTSGFVNGVSTMSTDDGEFMGYRKGTGSQGAYYPCGISNDSRVNSYWYDCSKKMFKDDRIQWLQNYRRKRWTQIRNICYAFLIEANTSAEIDMNDKQNVCDPSKGCKYIHPQASQQNWTSQYDEEWDGYQNYLLEQAQLKELEDIKKQLQNMTMTGETKDDRPPSKQKTFGLSELHEYRPPSVGDRLSKMEKMDDGTTRWFDGTIVKKTKTNTITIKWDDATYKNERYALKDFKRLYGTVFKYLEETTTAVISADYDGCFDVLFPDIEANYRSDYPDDDIEKDRQELLAHILQIEKKYDNIILLVGSTRQTPGIDKKIRNMMNIHRTIRFDTKTDDNLCFVNFATLAKERGWVFRDDVQFPDEIKADKSKVALIKAQLELSFVHDFYFFDNEETIIEKTTKAFQDSKNINIIQFEWT